MSLKIVKNDHGKNSEKVYMPRSMGFTYENYEKFNISWYYQVLFFLKKKNLIHINQKNLNKNITTIKMNNFLS